MVAKIHIGLHKLSAFVFVRKPEGGAEVGKYRNDIYEIKEL